MNTTRDALKTRARPARKLDLPGGPLYVRPLTVRELETIDRRAEDAPPGEDRAARLTLLVVLYSLAEPDGTPAFPGFEERDLDAVKDLDRDELRAVFAEVIPTKADAKNG